MAMPKFGLRAKSLLALLSACLVALLLTGAIGWQVVESIRNHFGEAYVRNYTLLSAQQILAPVLRDLALARRMADLVLLREWLRDEENPAKRELAFRELEGFRRDFREQSYFVASERSLGFYLNQPDMAYSETPRYVMDPQSPEDAWFFSTLEASRDYNINVNPDRLGFTKVWFNVLVRDAGELLGVAGSGLDLTNFISEFIEAEEPGVTPMLIDETGAIQAHPDTRLISYDTASSSANYEIHTLFALLATDTQRDELQQAIAAATRQPGKVFTFWAEFQGKHTLVALAYIPELHWYAVTAVDLNQANILHGGWFWGGLGTLLILLLVFLASFGYAVERLLLRPLQHLHQSATALARGHFDVPLVQSLRHDEIGDLTRAFGGMAQQIKSHTEELEGKVRQRTHELEQANHAMALTQKKINASIDYASLIQRAMLPDSQLASNLGDRHFVLWHPRDVVGGDFYLFRSDGERYLIGIVDCAGHGVPGALMTMLAQATFDDAMNRCGIESPAALLAHTDKTLREMIHHSELPKAIATNMDVGLAFVDRKSRLLRYAGAKIPLYWSDGSAVGTLPGGKRALCDRRIGRYEDHEVVLYPSRTYYLATDGYLDQAGGSRGYSFGSSRFTGLLQSHAGLPMTEQAEALRQTLDDYRGDHPQRDDITILSFRAD